MNVKFNEIVGLRFYLALWVAIGHGMQLAGFLQRSDPVSAFFLKNDSAVVIFMIISGFVITHLITTAGEPYPRYIVRRFIRLYPAFVLCCLLGALLLPTWSAMTVTAPWRDVAGWTAYAAEVQGIAQQQHTNPLPHVLAHAVMLHGIVPEEVVPFASRTFLPAAWSISLEWQFYLVAPLVLLACRSVAGTVVAIIIAALGYALFRRV